MKKKFQDKLCSNAVTPKRFISAIEKAVKYAHPSDYQLKIWLETDNQEKAIDEICQLIQQNVDKTTWKKLEI